MNLQNLKGLALAALIAGGALGSDLTLRPHDAQAAAVSIDGYVSFGPLVNNETISFLRFANVGSTKPTTFSIRYFGFPSGTEYTSADVKLDVPPYASPQMSYYDLSLLGPDLKARTGDSAVIAFIKANNTGTGIGIQHVTYNSATGYFENASVCTFDPAFSLDTTLLNGSLINVHSTTLSSGGYPSDIILINPDVTSRIVTGDVYEAATGVSIGKFPATTIPAKGSVVVSMASVEVALKYTPKGNQQYNIKFSSGDSKGYTAIPTDAVTQISSGARFNLTQACPLYNVINNISSSIFGGTVTATDGGGTTSTQPDVNLNPSGR